MGPNRPVPRQRGTPAHSLGKATCTDENPCKKLFHLLKPPCKPSLQGIISFSPQYRALTNYYDRGQPVQPEKHWEVRWPGSIAVITTFALKCLIRREMNQMRSKRHERKNSTSHHCRSPTAGREMCKLGTKKRNFYDSRRYILITHLVISCDPVLFYFIFFNLLLWEN